jgi:cell division protease FtsH
MNKNKQPNQMFKPQNTLIMWMTILTFSFITLSLFKSQNVQEIPFPEFLEAVKKNQIESVVFQGNEIRGKIKKADINGKIVEGLNFKSYGNTNAGVYLKILEENKITPEYAPESVGFMSILALALPFVLFFWLFSKLNKSGGGASGLMSSVSKMNKKVDPKDLKVKFADVAGIDEIRQEVSEVVDFLKTPEKFKKMGAKVPKGVLLIGPPGTGKTLLARAVAGEAGVPFFSISGSEFVEMFVGVGASRVRSLFEDAKKNAPCIVFIDEIDAVGKKRGDGSGFGGSHSEQENTLNQLLTAMDGFEENSGVIVIAATNRLDSLDPALLRAGRFDRKVRIDLPDMKGREQILKVHSKNKKMSPDIDYKILSQATTGMAGADIDNLLNEAALIAGRQEKESIDMVVIEEARDKILMGIERKNLVMKDEEKRKTAVHEAGHALITLLLPQLDRLHKVSIIPRGMALGVTQTTPEENLVSFNHEKAESYICMLMAGRAAEDIEFKHFSSGASDDLKRATMIARKMICEWGMSKKFGPISFNQSQNGFENNLISQQKMAEIDNEIQNMLTEMYEKTKDLLIKNNKSLVDIADLLMKKETCTGEEIKLLIG